MDLQFEPGARALMPTGPISAPGPLPAPPTLGRMHLLREGFLYTGPLAPVSSQRHSVLLVWSLDGGEFSVETAAGRVRAAALCVASGVRKTVHARGTPLVCIDIAPTHRHFRSFASASQGSDVQAWPREHFAALQAALVEFRAQRMSSSTADRLFSDLVALAMKRLPEPRPVDARIRTVMKLLRENRQLSMAELADAVCLSKDWLVHLFQREAGISLRKYEQVLKLQAAAVYLRSGVSMTEIAAIAGFADSAHFSKLWKQQYGFPPQVMFVGRGYVKLDPLPRPPELHAPREFVRAA
ncbi:MAG TPA: AraC family transcriptional regulator [Rhizobacter sp.]